MREYLVSQQVHAEQLTAKGYGKADPVASNATAEGRSQNRRVVMKVMENPGDVTIKEGASNDAQTTKHRSRETSHSECRALSLAARDRRRLTVPGFFLRAFV